MRAVGGIAGVLALLSGCSWLFDPAGLPTPDLAIPDAPPLDLAAPDLTVRDLLPPPADCAELPLFPGFFADGGAASPYDCRTCGCRLDDFTSQAEMARKWAQPISGNWSATVNAGALTHLTASGLNGGVAELESQGYFYLQGDFDLEVDLQVVSWVPGTYYILGVFGGPSDAGSNDPFGWVAFYNAGATARLSINLDGTYADIPALPSSTLEMTRAGGRLCAGMVGSLSTCRDSSREPVWAEIWSTQSNGGCIAGCGCCPAQARYSNLRLKSGVLVNHL